jgi:sigma-B regulation protein RsbU (phosphoserine phosphatase)
LHPGDVLLLGTDGLVEVRNKRGNLFGYDQLLTTMSTIAHYSASEIAQHLTAMLDSFRQGKPREDDQTLVVLKCSVA